MATSTATLTQLIQIDVVPACEDGKDEPESFLMPDLLRNFPWNKGLNKHYTEAKAESDAWLESLRPFSSKGHQIYNGWDFAYLAATCFTTGPYSKSRLAQSV